MKIDMAWSQVRVQIDCKQVEDLLTLAAVVLDTTNKLKYGRPLIELYETEKMCMRSCDKKTLR